MLEIYQMSYSSIAPDKGNLSLGKWITVILDTLVNISVRNVITLHKIWK